MATTVEHPMNHHLRTVQAFFLNLSQNIAVICFGCCCAGVKRKHKSNNVRNPVSRTTIRDPYNIFYNEAQETGNSNELDQLLGHSDFSGNETQTAIHLYSAVNNDTDDIVSFISDQSVDSKLKFPQNFLKMFNWYTDNDNRRANYQQLHSIRLNNTKQTIRHQRSFTSNSAGTSSDRSSISSRAFLLEGINKNNMEDNRLVEDVNFDRLLTNSSKSTFDS